MAFFLSRRLTTTGPHQEKIEMTLKDVTHMKASLVPLLSDIECEIDVTVRLLKSNAVGFAFIFIGGLLTRAMLSPMSVAETALATFKTAMVGFLCNYIFDIANQASSPLEDYLNKPHRPIPAGLITLHQARLRWISTWTLAPIVIYSCFGFWAALHLVHFQALIVVCYVWPGWSPWFMRNYFASMSYFILHRLLNQVPLARETSNWGTGVLIDMAVAFWLIATVHIQEFHDIEGDRKSNRQTLPMLVSDKGLKTLRAGTSMFVVVFGCGIVLSGGAKMAQDTLVAPICVLQQVLSCILAYRISASDSVEMDKATYHVYYYPVVLVILLSLVMVIR